MNMRRLKHLNKHYQKLQMNLIKDQKHLLINGNKWNLVNSVIKM